MLSFLQNTPISTLVNSMMKSVDSHKTVKFILCVVHNSLLQKLQIFPMLNIFYTVQSNKIPVKDKGYQLKLRINTVVEINDCLMAVKHFYLPVFFLNFLYLAYCLFFIINKLP